jgi:3-hydroxy-9,10-secoandrosta-1,3,5(10)-triene-9,17-dione monooxygenase reductase component
MQNRRDQMAGGSTGRKRHRTGGMVGSLGPPRIASTEQDPAAGFRRVMAEYPTGVVIIAAEFHGGPVGMACNSFTSVSLQPRLVSFCVAHTSTTWPLIRDRGNFCVNIMSNAHAELARTFSRRNVDRFGLGTWTARAAGPGLGDAMAWLDCQIWAEHEAGDHTIVIGEVMSMAAHPDAGAPLVFWRGGYGTTHT